MIARSLRTIAFDNGFRLFSELKRVAAKDCIRSIQGVYRDWEGKNMGGVRGIWV